MFSVVINNSFSKDFETEDEVETFKTEVTNLLGKVTIRVFEKTPLFDAKGIQQSTKLAEVVKVKQELTEDTPLEK